MRPTGHQTAPGGTTAAGAGIPTTGPAPNTAGPHRNDLLNKLDPTVDTQTGGTQVLGPGINASAQGRAPGHSSNATSATGAGVDTQQGVGHNYGPQHGQPLAGHHGVNTRAGGGNTYGSQYEAPLAGRNNAPTTGGAPMTHTTNAPEGTYGPHSSRLANAVDPRVDSDRDNRTHAPVQGQSTTVHQGPLIQPGPASKTAGPHKSNILNKLDPSVNSKATVTEQREYRIS